MSTTENAAAAAGAGQHEVEITVNEQAVTIAGPRVSGLEIKQAAINAGVAIQADFVLTEELPNNKTKVVGDGDIVTVNKNSRFLAVAPDDNS